MNITGLPKRYDTRQGYEVTRNTYDLSLRRIYKRQVTAVRRIQKGRKPVPVTAKRVQRAIQAYENEITKSRAISEKTRL